MIRILKNKTAEDVNVQYGNTTLIVPAGGQADLAEVFLAWQLAAIDELIAFLSQGVDKFQLNDGVNDLEAVAAIDLIRGYTGSSTPVVLTAPSGVPLTATADRLLVVNFPADFGANLWLTGRGDDLVNGRRGRGQALRMSFADMVRTEPEVQSVEIQFMEQVQLHDGHVDVKDPQNWGIDDEWDFAAVIPATTVEPSPGGNTGNCDLYPQVGYNVIVPAAGNGAYNIDLATAAPVPQNGVGGWDYDYFSNVLSFPTNPEQTSWVLLDVELVVYVQIAVNLPFSPMGVFDFDAYDAQRISPRWKLRLTVSKSSNGPGTLAGWVVCFRSQNT